MNLKSIEKCVETSIEIQKSRFICNLCPVSNEKEAKDYINFIKSNHPKAAHHTYAYVIKQKYQNIENQSDDGEPSKTAGLPMLDILRHEKLVNVVAVVTRYFGGTLLGTGGLIKAYSSALKKSVDAAHIIEAILKQGYEIKVSYSLHPIIEYSLKKENVIIKNISFEDEVRIVFYTENEKLIDYLKEKTNNNIKINELDAIYL